MNRLGTKILTTERLLLRPFRESDAEEVFENWAHDPEVTKYLTWTPHKSVEETRDVLKAWEAQYQSPDTYHWAIAFGGELIGDITLLCVTEWLETGTVGYCMMKKFWGKGIMTEAFREVLRFAFEEVELRRVQGAHAKANVGSSRVMEKCGLRYEGMRREGFRLLSTGEWIDIVDRAILRSDYFAERERHVSEKV